MKKLLFLLIMVVSLFSFTNVKAEEITEDNSYLLRQMVVNYNSKYSEIDYPYFVTYLRSGASVDGIFITIFSEGIRYYTTATYKLLGNYQTFYYFNNEIKLYNASTVTYTNIFYSNVDFLNSDGTIAFAKNYPKQEEVEPTPTTSPEPTTSPDPTTSPEPTDNPEIDTSELEKCDSFVCDISDSILSGFNDERFPFVKIIIKFLLLLLMTFLFISPLWLLYKIWRWIF